MEKEQLVQNLEDIISGLELHIGRIGEYDNEIVKKALEEDRLQLMYVLNESTGGVEMKNLIKINAEVLNLEAAKELLNDIEALSEKYVISLEFVTRQPLESYSGVSGLSNK